MHAGHPSDDNRYAGKLCVELKNGDEAVVVPGTLWFVDVINDQTGVSFAAYPVKKEAGTRSVCMRGAKGISKANGSLYVCGYATVEVVTKVPLGSDVSLGSSLPDYLNKKNPCATVGKPVAAAKKV